MMTADHETIEPLADVDEILRDFYRGEVPESWPELKSPGLSVPSRSLPWWQLGRSRLSLAASVLILLAGLVMGLEMLRGQPGSSGQVVDDRLPAEARRGVAPDISGQKAAPLPVVKSPSPADSKEKKPSSQPFPPLK